MRREVRCSEGGGTSGARAPRPAAAGEQFVTGALHQGGGIALLEKGRERVTQPGGIADVAAGRAGH